MNAQQIKPEKCWPHDTNYLCNCSGCGGVYFGPKRSPACWECVAQDTKNWWEERNVQK